MIPTKLSTAKFHERLLAFAVAFAGCLRLLIFSRMPDAELVKRIPDDAFYYLVPARNFVATGRWTFDGAEPASGFHLLWGYLLALFFRIWPNASLHAVLAIGGLFQVGCLSLAAYLVARTASRIFGEGALFGIAIVFFSASCLKQGSWLMETSLVILASSAILWMLSRDTIALPGLVGAGAFALGFISMMARSDAGMLAFIFFLAHFLLWRAGRVDGSMFKAASLVLGGAVTGLIAILLHTHWISGGWIQASALQKAFWTRTAGYSVLNILHFILSFFSPLYDATPLFTTNFWSHRLLHLAAAAIRALLLLAMAWAALRIVRSAKQPLATGIFLALVAVLLAYVLFYGFDNLAVQSWYVGNFVAPAALLTGAASAYYATRYWTFVFGVTLFMALCGFFFSLGAMMPWQETMYRAGIYLHDHPEVRPVASFNAGIIAYFARGGVTNVDGLMNDRILPYTRNGTLVQYFAKRHIDFLMESPQVFTEDMRIRGGYQDGKFERCIHSSRDLFPDDPDNVYTGGRLRLYEFDPKCLASAY
jgi:hypothetical protein